MRQDERVRVLVVDAQGGGIGRQLVQGIKKALPEAVSVTAVGTNAAATAAMIKAGADLSATGENAVRVAARSADYIVGPIGIVIADAMNGEISPAMALALAQSDARRILIPFNNCYNIVVGCRDRAIVHLIEEAIRVLADEVGEMTAG